MSINSNEWKYRLTVLMTQNNMEYFIWLTKNEPIRGYSLWLRLLGLMETRDMAMFK